MCGIGEGFGCFREDPLDAGPERADLAVPGERAFRKDAEQVAVVQALADGAERLLVGLRIDAPAGDGYRPAGAEDEVQYGDVVDGLERDEADGPAHGQRRPESRSQSREPMATATVNTVRNSVTTVGSPPRYSRVRFGIWAR